MIASDIDDTLGESIEACFEFNDWKINGIPATKADIYDTFIWHIPKFGLTKEGAHEWFHSFFRTPKIMDIHPIPGAFEKLSDLKKNGYDCINITSRLDERNERTTKWIKIHYPDIFQEILFTNFTTSNQTSKLKFCLSKNIVALIEDNLSDDIIDIANYGIPVYLIDQPRNQHYDPQIHKNIFKFKNWNEFKILD